MRNGQVLIVCRKFFLNTLCLGEDSFKRSTINTVLSSESESDFSRQETTLVLPQRKLKKQTDVCHIKQWLDLLPKVPSHYCRQSTSKIYIESTFLSVSSMYKVFQEWCNNENVPQAAKTVFNKTLKVENIKIHQPRVRTSVTYVLVTN